MTKYGSPEIPKGPSETGTPRLPDRTKHGQTIGADLSKAFDSFDKDRMMAWDVIKKIQDQYGIQIHLDTFPIVHKENLTFTPLAPKQIENILDGFRKLLTRLPMSLIRYANLREIVIVADLQTVNPDEKPPGGFAGDGNIVAAVGPSGDYQEFERIFMHELLHILDDKDGSHNDNKNWRNLHPDPDNAYIYNSGHEAIQKGAPKNYKLPPGFISEYAHQGGPNEDQAKIAEYLMTHNAYSRKKLLDKAKTDPLIHKKIEIITGCEYDPQAERFLKVYTPAEYKAKYGYNQLEFFAKWSHNPKTNHIEMDHNYWNIVIQGGSPVLH